MKFLRKCYSVSTFVAISTIPKENKIEIIPIILLVIVIPIGKSATINGRRLPVITKYEPTPKIKVIIIRNNLIIFVFLSISRHNDYQSFVIIPNEYDKIVPRIILTINIHHIV